jgi:glycogen synthase
MACGTPVVVGDTGGLREIVSDGSGLTFTPEDDEALADALIRVLTEDGLAERLVASGRARTARRYDWNTVARRTVEVYHQAITEEAELTGEEPRRPLRALLHEAPILELGTAG